MEETTHSGSINREAEFTINELFFSITSRDSTILSGNDVFVRISGYTREEAIGRYHNIVRHPDMPRIVFKIIWDTIKEFKPIAGYVKNRAKNGDYYWVFAALFPLEDRYVSIRIKPISPLFTVVKELYPELLMAETKGGMEESGRMVPVLLKGLGYENYDQFMSDALLQELRGRKEVLESEISEELKTKSDSELSYRLKAMHSYTKILMTRYDEWFDKIDTFIQVKAIFQEKSHILRQVAREIVFLSLNASVSSYKIASGGETFGILARDIRMNAKDNDALITRIDTLSHDITDTLNNIIFSFSGIRLQTEMLTYFIQELLCEEDNAQDHDGKDNIDTLVTLVAQYSQKTNALQIQIEQQLREAFKYLDQLEQQMMYLGYIQVYGIIEAAGKQHETVSFEGIFSHLKTLIQKTSQELEVMQKKGREFNFENRLLMKESDVIEKILEDLYKEMESIKHVA